MRLLQPQQRKRRLTHQKGSGRRLILWYNIIAKPLNQRKDCTTKMRNCQVRLNMNYEIYIEESSPVRVLSNVIDEIYHKEEYTIVSKWNGAVPEDIMMKILIYGYMNDSFSSRKIEQLCKRDIYFMWLLDGF